MKSLYHVIALFAVWLLLSIAPQMANASDRPPQFVAPEATTSPLRLIYRVAGIRDNGGAANTGTATLFHCTNYQSVSNNLRIRVYNFNGSLVADNTRTVGGNVTTSVATHGTVNIEDLPFLSPGVGINQGSAIISATTGGMICSVIVVDASAAPPIGTPLHQVRVNPQKNTSE